MPPQQLKLALDEALELTKALKPAAKAIDGAIKALESPDGAPLGDISKKIGALERATDRESLKRALPALAGAVAEAREALGQIGRTRRDVVLRREGLAAVAKDRGLPFKHGDRCDWLGPFRLDHSEHVTTVKLGRVSLGRLKDPSAREAFRFVEQIRGRLEQEALAGWDEFANAALQRQEVLSPTEPVRWKELVEHAVPDSKERRRRAPSITYRLALLIFGGAPGGWAFTCVPPTLAEQKEAIEVPDLRHPGESVRVVRGRLRRA